MMSYDLTNYPRLAARLAAQRQAEYERRNHVGSVGTHTAKSKQAQGGTLVGSDTGKDESFHGNLERLICGKRFSITFTIYSTRPQDWDNIHVKELQDCCVNAGLLPGDDWQTLEGRVISRKCKTKKEQRTEIRIEKTL